jgi:hypothetical protein
MNSDVLEVVFRYWPGSDPQGLRTCALVSRVFNAGIRSHLHSLLGSDWVARYKTPREAMNAVGLKVCNMQTTGVYCYIASRIVSSFRFYTPVMHDDDELTTVTYTPPGDSKIYGQAEDRGCQKQQKRKKTVPSAQVGAEHADPASESIGS